MSHCPFGRVHVLAQICLVALFVPHATAQNSNNWLSGWVYIDRNNDGQLAFADQPNPEYVLTGVEIKLYELVGAQEVLVGTSLTNANGMYSFSGLDAGTYLLRQTQPVEYVDGIDSLGMLRSLGGQPLPGNASPGAAGNNEFTGIVLTGGLVGEMYNFGERGLMPAYMSKRSLLGTTPPLPTTDRVVIPEPSSVLLLIAAAVGTSLRYRSRFVL